jgi:hypothetical protein
MTDYIPNPPNPERDPRNDERYYEADSGKGLTVVIGLLVAIALIGGLMFFSGPRGDRTDLAQQPPAQERKLNVPDQPRAPAAPPPANPAPTAPQQ